MSPGSLQEVSKCNQDRPQRPQDKHKIQRSRLQSVCNQAGCRDVQKRIQKIAQDASQKLPRCPQGGDGGGSGGSGCDDDDRGSDDDDDGDGDDDDDDDDGYDDDDRHKKPQDEPKIVTKVPKGHRNRLECWLDPDDDGYDAIRMIFRRTNCLGSTRRYHFYRKKIRKCLRHAWAKSKKN